jgi:hypothetical protein
MHFALPCFLPPLAPVIFIPSFEGGMAAVCLTDAPSDVIVVAVAGARAAVAVVVAVVVADVALASSVTSLLRDLAVFFLIAF